MLDVSAAAGKFGYHPGCRNIQITHLCFADDIMVFADGRMKSVESILSVFDQFAKFSGLKISLEKTTMFMTGISPLSIDRMLSRFPFEIGTLPVRYLGLPLMTKRMSKNDCFPLIEKIRTRIGSWKNRFLSFAGRLQLLSSVIASLTNFWIAAFRLPSSCVKEIEKISSAFLWSGPELNPRKSKIAWREVCRPKQEGGLGLKSIEEANKVSCLKLIWRLVSSKNSMWVNWVQQQLIRRGSFWSVKDGKNAGSWMWKKLIKYRSIAKDFHMIKVGNGEHTSFWFENWCSLGRLSDVLGSRGYIDMGINSNATLADVIASHRVRRHRVDIMNQIEDEIRKLKDIGSNAPDVALWRGKENKFKNMFSFKETWNHIRNVMPTKEWYKGVWFPQATPKYSFIVWLASHNRLSTGDRMIKWHGGVNSRCVFCDAPLESRDHLFFVCRFVSQIWHQLVHKITQQRHSSFFGDILDDISETHYSPTHQFILRYTFQTTVYSIWRERNRRRHGEQPTPAVQLIKDIGGIVRNRLSTLQNKGTRRFQDVLREWFATRDP